MEALGVTLSILGLFLFYFLTRKKKKKVMKKPETKEKNWVVFEHTEGEKQKENKCYFVQHKKTSKKSPCFNEKIKLNEWLKQNAE